MRFAIPRFIPLGLRRLGWAQLGDFDRSRVICEIASPLRRHAAPAHALPALEASVRLKSFARAAEELGVTASAVTQHVRTVEVWVGKPLFQRRGRYVVPTDIAEAAMPSQREGFDRLSEGTRLLRAFDRKTM